MVSQCDEILRGMPKMFCEIRIDSETRALEGKVLVASLFHVFVLELAKRARARCGLQCMLWRNGCIVDSLWDMKAVFGVDAQRI